MPSLFDPVNFGAIRAGNRILMAPLTRGRADAGYVPNDLMVEYYRQRAGAGLIITEATAISPQGYGWYGAPGLWRSEHLAGWRKVTDAVHAAGGKIVFQLWHMGRMSHPDLQEDGLLPVAPSALAPSGKTRDAAGEKPYVTPRALDAAELPGIAEDFARAAGQAIEAGFDGVEVHGANGYLLDQFLRDGSNARTDRYGGSIENRLRFPLEVVGAVVQAVGAERTGIRISPYSKNGGMSDKDPVSLFTAFAERLNGFDLAYLHVLEALEGSAMYAPGERVTPHIRKVYAGHMIGNGGYNQEKAQAMLDSSELDAVAFGVLFIANPDLPERFREHAALNRPDAKTFYTAGAQGYTDYPFLTAS